MLQGKSVSKTRIARISTTTALLMVAGTWADIARAQAHTPPSAPPVRKTVDEYGVDLITGRLRYGISELIAGPVDGHSISYDIRNDKASVTDGDLARIYVKGYADYTVSLGDRSFKFLRAHLPDGTFAEVESNGTSLSYNSATTEYTFTDRSGTQYIFQQQQNLAPNGEGPDGLDMGPLVKIVEPNGHEKTFTYAHGFKPILNGIEMVGVVAYRRLQSVQSSVGWMIKPEYDSNDDNTLEDLPAWSRLVKVTAFDNSNINCSPSADSCAMPLGHDWPTVTLQLNSFGYTDLVHPNGVGEEFGFHFRRWIGESAAHFLVTRDNGKVSSVSHNGVNASYNYSDTADIRTTTRSTAHGSEVYKFDTTDKLLLEYTSATGNTTKYQYDSSKRLTQITRPEGGYEQITYGPRGNVTSIRKVPKPGSNLADIVVSASYDANCMNSITCNKPNSTTGARGKVTNYTYDPNHGGVLTVTAPAATAGGIRPQTRYGYTQVNGIYELTSISTCQNAASCVGGAGEAITTIAYNGKNLRTSVTTAAGNGSVSASVGLTYDAIGNVSSIDGPLAGAGDNIRFRYNDGRQRIGVIGPDPDGAGPRKHNAQRTTFDSKGRVAKVESGTVNSQSDLHWGGLSVITSLTNSYDDHGNKIKEVTAGTSGASGIVQYEYDSGRRLLCAAVRMNQASWSSLPASACTATAASSAGPDRITRWTYDGAGRTTKIETAVGTSAMAVELRTGYTPDGQVDYVIDGESNRTTYIYDGYNRLSQVRFPSSIKGANISNATDYEKFSYDAANNVISRRLRDGTTIVYSYDNLGRLKKKNLPGSEADVTFAYNLMGRPTSVTQGSHVLTFTTNALGRVTSQTGPLGAIGYTYDMAGRRLTMTYPGSALTIGYEYDAVGNVTKIRENGATGGAGVLATYSFDSAGRPSSVTFGNGSVQSWSFNADSRLSTLSNNLGGSATTFDLTQTFAYNPAGQLVSSTRNNDAYAWQEHYNVDRTYITDGLNRNMSVGALDFTYDARGNLSDDGRGAYIYTAENLLKEGPASTTLAYDPLGRLYKTIGGGKTTRFQYDGTNLIAEYTANNVVARRYVHGPSIDNPIVWYEGDEISNATRRFLMSDERGSVLSITNSSGAVININSYNEYGIPGAGNIGRFGFTGQAWIPELGMWYYKARVYSPTLGRFMQTDPTGYADGMNWYNYVASDPVNSADSSGMSRTCDFFGSSPGDIQVCATGQRRPPAPVSFHVYMGRYPTHPLSSYGRPPVPARATSAAMPQSTLASNITEEDRDRAAEDDYAKCRKLSTKQAREACWRSAAERDAARVAGRPVPPLQDRRDASPIPAQPRPAQPTLPDTSPGAAAATTLLLILGAAAYWILGWT